MHWPVVEEVNDSNKMCDEMSIVEKKREKSPSYLSFNFRTDIPRKIYVMDESRISQ